MNISFDSSVGSQERQDKLREMGFVDILHKLSQASDTNLSDRWATAAHHEVRTLVKQGTLSVCVCLAGQRQQCSSTWRDPGGGETSPDGLHLFFFSWTWFYCTKAQFLDLWWVVLHLPHLQLRQASVAWFFLLDASFGWCCFHLFFFFFFSSKWAAGSRRCSWPWQ